MTPLPLDNLKATLERCGSSLDHVVKVTVFLADMAEWPAFNAIYREYFREEELPARSALGVNGLALGARVELECVAIVSQADRGPQRADQRRRSRKLAVPAAIRNGR